jgi:hypothetical protein
LAKVTSSTSEAATTFEASFVTDTIAEAAMIVAWLTWRTILIGVAAEMFAP